MAQLIAGRYELEELVGVGGMSNVFRAHDRLLERSVALKLLHEQFGADEDYVERFRREARAVAQLSHPNIVTVIDRGEEDGRQFIVFEYVDGENLKQRVERGALPVPEAVALGLQVARALEFAHRGGLVHRDVKPQNVLLDESGHAKVTDFGIARTLDVKGLTQTGAVLGTSNYIAPEQARGEPVDEKTDVYSLGAVLYELLTGEVPFPGENFVAVAMRHLNEPPPSPLERRPDVPPRLDAAVRSALAKHSEERPSMEELVAELEACLGGPEDDADREPTLIVPGRVVRASRRRDDRARRRLWPIVAPVLVLAVGGAVLVAVLATRGGSRSPARAGGGTPSSPIRLAGVGAFDPQGDGSEHDTEAPAATDGNPQTFWTTEHYRSFQKSGVGLVLDAGRTVKPSRLTVRTDTPGFTAEIQGGSSRTGSFRAISGGQTVNDPTSFALRPGSGVRYLVVWITKLPPDGVAHVNEVKASVAR